MTELNKIVDQLSKLTILESVDLVKMLEKTWGVSSSMPTMVTTAQNNTESKILKEKLDFDLILDNVGDKKISVIKEIKSILGLGLREAKEFVESAPKTIKSAISKDKAEELKKKLESTGAKILIK